MELKFNHLSLLVLSVLNTFWLEAQTFPIHENKIQFWNDGKLMSYDPETNILKTTIKETLKTKKNKLGQKEFEITINRYYRSINYYNNSYWACNNQAVTGEKEGKIFSSMDGTSWLLEGTFRPTTVKKQAVDIFPVGPDRFLMIAFTTFEKDGKFSRFAIARRNEKMELIITDLLDMNLKHSWGLPNNDISKKGWSSILGINDRYSQIFLGGYFVLRLKEAIAIVHTRPGYTWVLPTNKDSNTSKLIKIYPTLGEEFLDGSKKVEHCVLGAQPLQNGNILFATRSESALRFGAENHPTPRGPQDLNSPVFNADLNLYRKMSIQDHPDLVWWELDPDLGTISRVPSPSGVPERIQSIESIQNFSLWLEPDGQIKTSLSK